MKPLKRLKNYSSLMTKLAPKKKRKFLRPRILGLLQAKAKEHKAIEETSLKLLYSNVSQTELLPPQWFEMTGISDP